MRLAGRGLQELGWRAVAGWDAESGASSGLRSVERRLRRASELSEWRSPPQAGEHRRATPAAGRRAKSARASPAAGYGAESVHIKLSPARPDLMSPQP